MRLLKRFKVGFSVAIMTGVVLFAVAPLLLPDWIIYVLTMALAKGMVAFGVALVLRGGLISFGHGLYYAAGAYAAAFAVNRWNIRESLILIPLCVLTGAALAALAGMFLKRYRGIFFALLSLAFSMILYTLLFKFYDVTGGTDGMHIPSVKILGIQPAAEGFFYIYHYYLTLILMIGVLYIGWRFISSPLGYLMQAVHDNEIRVEYMGASVERSIYLTYVFSGALGGLGGGLVALAVKHVSPEFAYWTASADFVFVAILGGTGSVFAPFLGSIVFEFVKNYAFKFSPNTWQMTLGGILLLIIFFLPQGLWSLAKTIKRKEMQ
ncbi:MAG: branched-chain amino acid ABC transporter permease [Proteobacteria bacterium]|nr:branched-chain amino acid ABC transporter permease [Pseudomonadota bacterium]